MTDAKKEAHPRKATIGTKSIMAAVVTVQTHVRKIATTVMDKKEARKKIRILG